MAKKRTKGSSYRITKKEMKHIKTLVYIDVVILVGIICELFIFYR